jgi:lipoxygenase
MINSLPLRHFGLTNMPAVPYLLTFSEPLLTLFHLARRSVEVQPAKDGLSNVYKIGGQAATAYEFLYGTSASQELARAGQRLKKILERGFDGIQDAIFREDKFPNGARSNKTPLTALSLDEPGDFSLSWTNFQSVFQQAQPLLPEFSASLQDVQAAADQFWPTIANSGSAYNLLVLQAVNGSQADSIRKQFGDLWGSLKLDQMQSESRLYAIDMTIFASLKTVSVDGFERFTPATVTLLEQDAMTKRLRPFAVRVESAGESQLYSNNSAPGAWLYALQAAKTSATVWGIWLGHVYHWHIVTAALQMTLANTIAPDHPISQLAAPQSNYLIAFDEVLLLLWSFIAPPTSVSTPYAFLRLCDLFAKEREFFDDDPLVTLTKADLKVEAFTEKEPWDLYPVVSYLLELWNSTKSFVDVFVNSTYSDDAAVTRDEQLQAWMVASKDPQKGNVRGLPAMTSRDALGSVLTSFLYRITAHGISRLNNSANPVLTFTANFPPCLQSSQLPSPQQQMDTKQLLAFLPKTGTIGQMINFYFIFVFSAPYVSFIPPMGVEADLFFPSGLADPRNVALVARRKALISFIENTYEPGNPQFSQWPMNIET